MAFPEVSKELVERYDVEVPRYTSYPTVPVWSNQFGPKNYAEVLEAAGERLSLYVHLPFCRTMCAFCGCNMVVRRDEFQVDEYLEAVEAELGLVAERLGGRRRLVQIHWGGGTPTTLEGHQIERLWRAIERRFDVADHAEIAIEVAPDVTSPAQLELLRRLGFNRLSMGVQDLSPAVLSVIGRHQGADSIAALLERARNLGFRGLNVDLIYGLPRQTPTSWADTLQRLLAMGPDRAAIYSFAYIPHLRHNQRRLPAEDIPHGASKLGLFKLAYDAFEAAGYLPIGMDHFARADDELAIAQQKRTLRRNFQGYTASPASEVVAVGATAISDVGGAYAQNERALAYYQTAVRSGQLATDRGIVLSPDDRRRRQIIEELMCNFWTDLGPDAGKAFGPELERLRGLEREGLVRVAGGEIEATELGRVFIRNVVQVFDAHPQGGESHSRAV